MKVRLLNAPEVRYAKSGNVNIAYSVLGDGPFDLVFVSGWVLSVLGVAWEGPAAETLSRLASFSRLILFDKRGTGLSDRATGIPDLETRMDDIRAVMDAAGSKRAVIMGVSEGGPMTLLFAATYPERTAAAILYGTGPSNVQADDYPGGLSPQQRPEYLERLAASVGTKEYMDTKLEQFSPSLARDEAARQWWRRWIQTSVSPGAIVDLARMNLEIDARHTLSAISVPTLVIHPVGDKVVFLGEGRYMAERIPGAEIVELPGEDHGWWVRAEEIGRESGQFLRRVWDRGDWKAAEPERVLATVLFTDIVGSTAKLAELGDRRWQNVIQQHHALVRRQLLRFSGREIETSGDGFFASFDGPARAIRCAQTITEAVHDLELEVRAGLHTGECELVDRRVGGIAVHIGARVAAIAGPGEVLVSSTVKDLVAGSGLTFEDRGRHELKGVPGQWQLYAVARS